MTTTATSRTHSVGVLGADDLVLTVAAKEHVATDIVSLVLQAADGTALPAWDPGAHIEVRLPGPAGDLLRHYSLCGDPADTSSWRVAVLREPESRGGSAFIHDQLNAGDSVTVTGLRNNFPLTESGRYLFVAGGIGITPILPMVREVAGRGGDWRFVACTRSTDRLPFPEEIGALGADEVTVHVDQTAGLLDVEALLAACDADTSVYVCGPTGLIHAIEGRSEDGPWQFFAEQFVADAVDTSGDQAFDVVIDSTGQQITIPAGASILHTLNDQGFDLPSSCEEGTCGTCETGVLDGIPDHRDVVLSKAEKAENDCMMICVSRAACPRLVLEL